MNKTRIKHVRIDPELEREIERFLAHYDTTFSEFTREALRDKMWAERTLVDSGVPYQTKEAS